jgi:uncharacterized protein YdaU (DUF1376 family)
MDYYRHNFADFALPLRGLTFAEQGIYRALVDLYLNQGRPLTSNVSDIERMLTIRAQDEKEALLSVLNFRFTLDSAKKQFTDSYCDCLVAEFAEFSAQKARAGRVSAAKKKAQQKSTGVQQNSTPVQQNSTGVE